MSITPHLTEGRWTCPVCGEEIRFFTEVAPAPPNALNVSLYADALRAHVEQHIEEIS